jgi:hypothetical protein
MCDHFRNEDLGGRNSSSGVSNLFVLAILFEFSVDTVSIQTVEKICREETMCGRSFDLHSDSRLDDTEEESESESKSESESESELELKLESESESESE